MKKIVDKLMKRQDAVPFLEPVDWQGLGLVDYPKMIKKPMDLGTVKKKIEENEYASVHACAEDIRLVWSNCKKYNQDGSDFFNLAESLSKRFEDQFAKVKAEDPMIEDDTEHAPSLEEKTKFSHMIYKIKQEELGQLVEKLEDRCPEAIDKTPNDDELEINIDAIDPKTFRELDKFVKACIVNNQPKKKKRAAESTGGSVASESKTKKSKTS